MDLSYESSPLKRRHVHSTTENNHNAKKSAHRLLAAADIYPPFPRNEWQLIARAMRCEDNTPKPTLTQLTAADNVLEAWRLRYFPQMLPLVLQMTSKVITGLLAYAKVREMRLKIEYNAGNEKVLWERFAISTMENSFTRLIAIIELYCDRYVGRIKGLPKERGAGMRRVTMAEHLKQIGIPEDIVCARHEFAHREEVPCAVRLLEITEEMRQWLWRKFWHRVPRWNNWRQKRQYYESIITIDAQRSVDSSDAFHIVMAIVEAHSDNTTFNHDVVTKTNKPCVHNECFEGLQRILSLEESESYEFARALCDKIALLAIDDVDVQMLIAKYKEGEIEVENISSSYLSKIVPTKLRTFISVILSLANYGISHFITHIVECSLLRIQQSSNNDKAYLLALVVSVVLTHLQQSARQLLNDSDELNKAIGALYLSLVNAFKRPIRLPEQTIKQIKRLAPEYVLATAIRDREKFVDKLLDRMTYDVNKTRVAKLSKVDDKSIFDDIEFTTVVDVFGTRTDTTSVDDMLQKCSVQNDDDEIRVIGMDEDTEEQLSTVFTTSKETRQKPLHEEGVRIGIFTAENACWLTNAVLGTPRNKDMDTTDIMCGVTRSESRAAINHTSKVFTATEEPEVTICEPSTSVDVQREHLTAQKTALPSKNTLPQPGNTLVLL